MKHINPNQLWTQVPVASRTVEVNTKTGFTAAVSDKTGFSLTAGSYSVLETSIQQGYTNMGSTETNTNTTITSMALTRSHLTGISQRISVSGALNHYMSEQHNGDTNINNVRTGTSHTTYLKFEVIEYW